MGSIVFIHGMGHDTNREYWRRWANALLPYLIKQGIKPAEIYFSGIYYYDLVPQPGDGWKKITSPFTRDIQEEMQKDLFGQIARGESTGDSLGRGPLANFIDLVADNFGDIFTYLLDEQVYQQVNNRFYQGLVNLPGPITLIAYSLGTMVSFCAMQQRPDLVYPINHFITLGSPIFWFRKWLQKRTKLAHRPTDAHWTNLAGHIDVACPHLISYEACSPDTNLECELDRFNPVKGHLAYFQQPAALQLLAKEIAAHWQRGHW